MALAKKSVGFKSGDSKEKKVVDYESQVRHIFSDLIPGEAAIAFDLALNELGMKYEEAGYTDYGSFFPKIIPFTRYEVRMKGVEYQIPWGKYIIKGFGEVITQMSATAIPCLQISCFLEDKNDKPKWKTLVELTEKLAEGIRMFRGAAVKIESPWDLVVPKPIDVERITPIFMNALVQEQLDTSIIFPIRHRERIQARGVKLKRGIILHGHYGTGKTLLAYNIAQEAVAHGAGFILTDNSLARQGLMTARRLAPSVLFLEDLDEQGSKGRDGLNELLNTLSGVESKADLPVITIVSTNFLGRIDPAFLRPDRFDAIIEMELPDPLTTRKLVDVFCGNLKGDWGERGWTELVQALQGATPAIIGEVVDRAKISAIVEERLIGLEELHKHILAMKPQIDAARPKFNDETPEKRFANDLHRISRYGA